MNKSTLACLPVERSSKQRTLYPIFKIASQRLEPMKPAPPVTRKRVFLGNFRLVYIIVFLSFYNKCFPFISEKQERFPCLVVLWRNQLIQAEDEGEDEPEVEGVEGHNYCFSNKSWKYYLKIL